MHDAVLDAAASRRASRSSAPRRSWWRSASRNRRACRRRWRARAVRGASASCRRRRRSRRRGRQRRAKVGRPALDAVSPRPAPRTFSALRPTRIGSGMTRSPFGSAHAAVRADRQDRADQVLVGAHAAGDAVHDDAESAVAMRSSSRAARSVRAVASQVTDWLLVQAHVNSPDAACKCRCQAACGMRRVQPGSAGGEARIGRHRFPRRQAPQGVRRRARRSGAQPRTDQARHPRRGARGVLRVRPRRRPRRPHRRARRRPTSGCSTTTSATRRRSTPPVLLDAYRDIREGEHEAAPRRAAARRRRCEKLVGFTFDHFRDNPWFIRLLATENIQRADFVKQHPRDPRAAFADRRPDPPRCSPRARRRGHLPPRRRPGAALHHDRRHQLFLLLQHPHAVGDLRRAARSRRREMAARRAPRRRGRARLSPAWRAVNLALRHEITTRLTCLK